MFDIQGASLEGLSASVMHNRLMFLKHVASRPYAPCVHPHITSIVLFYFIISCLYAISFENLHWHIKAHNLYEIICRP